MRPITIAGFTGVNRALNPRLLAEEMGVAMTNAEIGRGDLRPLGVRSGVATVPASPQRKSIWRMGADVPSDANYWLSWSDVVSATQGFDGDDTTERTYFTGNGTPKWTNNVIALGGGAPYPQAARELAVPAPIQAPTLQLITNGTGTEANRFYVQTFVNDIGWESAPSAASVAVLAKGGASTTVTGLVEPPSGNYGITKRRLYRTQADATGDADFFFLAELDVTATEFTDTDQALGDALSTTEWLAPPENGFGIIALWRSMFAMLSGKTLHISPVGAAYAYPVRQDIELKDKAVATAKWEQNLLVLTTGRPVLVTGETPDAMSDMQLSLVQPCVSARGVAAMSDGVVWPSNEGLAFAGGGRQVLLTEGILTPTQWKALRPSTIVAGRYGRLYVASFDDGAGRKGFIVDPSNPVAFTFLDSGFDACHYDELADVLYVLEGGEVRKFDAGPEKLLATFRSKVFRQTVPVNYGYAKVLASGYPLTLRVWSDHKDPITQAVTHPLRLERHVQNGDAFTLPSGYVSEDWQVEIVSQHDVQSVRLATDVTHLKGM